jgi:hypothetical protein
MPGIDRIQRELEVIARLDEMFRQKKDPSLSDLLRCQARQSRRQELLEMVQKVGAKVSPVIAFARKRQNPRDKARIGEVVTHKSRVN